MRHHLIMQDYTDKKSWLWDGKPVADDTRIQVECPLEPKSVYSNTVIINGKEYKNCKVTIAQP